MESRVDKFGRVVIPKRLRLHLGLRTGVRLTIEEQGHAIILRPQHEQPRLVIEDGVLVFSGQATGDLTEEVRGHREERLDRLARRTHR